MQVVGAKVFHLFDTFEGLPEPTPVGGVRKLVESVSNFVVNQNITINATDNVDIDRALSRAGEEFVEQADNRRRR